MPAMRQYRPSPLSTCVNARNIAPLTKAERVFEQKEDLPQDLGRCPPPVIPLPAEPCKSSPDVMLDASTKIVQPCQKTRKSVPKYWDATQPLKGESKEDAERAARSARYRELDERCSIFELFIRSPHLLDYALHEKLGTAPVAAERGNFKLPNTCSYNSCLIHDLGLSPALILASKATDLLQERLDLFEIEEEKQYAKYGFTVRLADAMAIKREALEYDLAKKRREASALYREERERQRSLEG